MPEIARLCLLCCAAVLVTFAAALWTVLRERRR